jgi:hypothetical protein
VPAFRLSRADSLNGLQQQPSLIRRHSRGFIENLSNLIAQIWGRLGDEDVDDDLLREVLLLLGYDGNGEHQVS